MKLLDRILDKIECPACMRLRFGPVHLYLRMIGLCDGENMRMD